MHLLSDSPFIARILGFCLDPRTILMKYYETGTMEDYFKRDQNVSLSLKLCFASDIAKGVEALHAVGISHNDLKPQNILLDITKDRLVCVITDFGISSVLNHDLLSVEAFVVANLRGVSLRYAPPEAIRRFRERQPSSSATVDVFKAGDIYSTGSIYCFLFTNVEPWSPR
jgi:serine/threonine protein kinase